MTALAGPDKFQVFTVRVSYYWPALGGTNYAQTATPPAPTATVAPMTVGQPMMLQDADGNTIMIMQGSTFYIFPKAIATPKP